MPEVPGFLATPAFGPGLTAETALLTLLEPALPAAPCRERGEPAACLASAGDNTGDPS